MKLGIRIKLWCKYLDYMLAAFPEDRYCIGEEIKELRKKL